MVNATSSKTITVTNLYSLQHLFKIGHIKNPRGPMTLHSQ